MLISSILTVALTLYSSNVMSSPTQTGGALSNPVEEITQMDVNGASTGNNAGFSETDPSSNLLDDDHSSTHPNESVTNSNLSGSAGPGFPPSVGDDGIPIGSSLPSSLGFIDADTTSFTASPVSSEDIPYVIAPVVDGTVPLPSTASAAAVTDPHEPAPVVDDDAFPLSSTSSAAVATDPHAAPVDDDNSAQSSGSGVIPPLAHGGVSSGGSPLQHLDMLAHAPVADESRNQDVLPSTPATPRPIDDNQNTNVSPTGKFHPKNWSKEGKVAGGVASILAAVGVFSYLWGGNPEPLKEGPVNLANGESHVPTTTQVEVNNPIAASTMLTNVNSVASPVVNSVYTSESAFDTVMSTNPPEMSKGSSFVVSDYSTHITPATTITSTADALPTSTEIEEKLSNIQDVEIQDIKDKVDEAFGEKHSNGNGVNFAEPSPDASFTVKDEIHVEDLKEAASEATPDQQIKAWSITQYLNFIGFISVKECVGVFLVILYYSVRGMIPLSFSVPSILKSAKNVKSLKSKTVKKPVLEPLPKEKETSAKAKESLSNNTVVDVEQITIDQVKVKENEKEKIVQDQNENEKEKIVQTQNENQIVPPNVSVKDTEDFARISAQDSETKKEMADKSIVKTDDNTADDNNNGDSNATVVVGGIVAGLGVLGIASFAAYKKHKQSI
ncbi:hypothetical protein ROZALSC1DRAFT_21153 [Rozella allomycis CSF55]|uniref:Uncharacterized protein n=1 Tax=Rozella allomycis (strain CSF55) TaxID=988480 RepID=A0A4P9YM17_ROZAC|nr:hypothetical protein ROZALSC1DRAFT_21153 [Rozella allomycis CSF55]